VNIRKKRSKPGLRHQHVACVNAAAEICGARCTGNVLGSETVEFFPTAPRAGNYFFNIPTAGSAMQVVQTVLPILSFAAEPSTVTVRGGTHNPAAPPYDFFHASFLPLLRRVGITAEIELRRYGFFPIGGGEIAVKIFPSSQPPHAFAFHHRGELISVHSEILISRLPQSIAQRESKILQQHLQWPAAKIKITEISDSPGPGNVILIHARYGETTYLFTAFGQRGKPAEKVALEACETYLDFHRSNTALDEHLTNQIILYLALKNGGAFTSHSLSRHTETNIEVLKRFLEATITVEKKDDRCFEIHVERFTR
ncbi:MAG: RNA 3'-terminal phosphate cyclase, partial [candidate division KSB1 bacterium]|nr:RNA 3'-terminal phosphate cyclase [candidate division KSB1 bacterium]